MLKLELRVEGISAAEKRLAAHSGVNLQRATQRATLVAARGMVKPMRAAAPVADENHRGKYAHKKGQLARSVKARRARARPGESGAAVVGPTVWYRHFPIRGAYGGSRKAPEAAFVGQVAARERAQTRARFQAELRRQLNTRR